MADEEYKEQLHTPHTTDVQRYQSCSKRCPTTGYSATRLVQTISSKDTGRILQQGRRENTVLVVATRLKEYGTFPKSSMFGRIQPYCEQVLCRLTT